MILCYQGKQGQDVSGFFFHLHLLPFDVRAVEYNRLPFVIAMKIKSKNKKPRPLKVMYICNRKKCQHCIPECHHTSDPAFAKYKEHIAFDPGKDGILWELR